MSTASKMYGMHDNSYKAAGELAGLTKLVDLFYDFMDSLPDARSLRLMHKPDLTDSRTKLAYFLSGWLGGPKLYAENFGSINIPMAHKHLPISRAEIDAWILCMQKAVEQQPYDDSFKVYLIKQLRVPAERIGAVCGV